MRYENCLLTYITLGSDPVEVKAVILEVTDKAIFMEYNEGGKVTWEGDKNEFGYYDVHTSKGDVGRLHEAITRNHDSILEGFWSENGHEGFWIVTLKNKRTFI